MESSTKKKTIILAILITLIVVASISVVIAAYTMTSPVSDPLIVNPTPTPAPTPSPTPVPLASLSKVATSVTTLYIGNTVVLSTTVSDSTAGIVVNFFNQNNAAVGTATTNAEGLASTTITPPLGTWTYYATASHT